MSARPLLAARALTKRFPGVVALKDITFELAPGEIHALCGENGAGKSTLIKLLSGIHPAGTYEGELQVDGAPASFRSVRDAERCGISVITQELALVEELTVAENIFLGREPRRGWRIDWPSLRAQTRTLLQDFGLGFSPDCPIKELGVGHRQLVEIIRALSKRSRVLVLDEPTAALTAHEVAVLLAHLRRLRSQGTACIYISHKLDEVCAIADRITVLRDGCAVGTLRTADTTTNDIIKRMVGREITDLYPKRQVKPAASEPLLAVRSLSIAPRRGEPDFLTDISFELRPGEVLGIGGLMGSGRTELLLHLYGAWGHRTKGEVDLRGAPYPRPAPRRSIERGLALVGEDRRRYGLMLEQSIGFNLSLSSLPQFTTRAGRIDPVAENRRNRFFFDTTRIKAPAMTAAAGSLSGGNQQKIVIGKALMTTPAVVMFDEPTRGIDVGAKLEVYELINRLCDEGKAVLLVSSELPELMGVSDRIVMLARGRIGGVFSRNDFNPETLLSAAMGREAADRPGSP